MAKQQESWMENKWRPAMAWTYMAINIFDFIIGPIFYNVLQYLDAATQIQMWQAITLQGGGLIHVAFGAVLGISAWTRGSEKIERIRKNAIDGSPES